VITVGSLIAFGLGIVVGAVGAFGGGRRYERAHRASVIAAGYLGEARTYGRQAVGGVALFVLVVAVGALAVWVGR
jgi:short subunit fatty acids transporter